jgi:hypothetical protein
VFWYKAPAGRPVDSPHQLSHLALCDSTSSYCRWGSEPNSEPFSWAYLLKTWATKTNICVEAPSLGTACYTVMDTWNPQHYSP